MTEAIQTYDETQQMFASRLKSLREASGLSQADLAEKLGVSRGSISNYENCTRIPDITFLCRASDFFCVGTSYLLGKSDQEEILARSVVKSIRTDVQQWTATHGEEPGRILVATKLYYVLMEYAKELPFSTHLNSNNIGECLFGVPLSPYYSTDKLDMSYCLAGKKRLVTIIPD